MPDLTPAQNEAVRRRLADARHTDALPADVAARLDGALADLVAERSTDADVVPLRRRRWPALLAAAAAVTALGVAATQLTGDDPTPVAEPQADPGAAATDFQIETGRMPLGTASLLGDSGRWSASTLRSLGFTRIREVPVVASALAENRAYADQGLTEMANDLDSAKKLDGFHRSAAGAACGPTELEPGTVLYTARYDGQRVVLTKAPPTEEGVLVAVYDCSGEEPGTPSETFTLPSPE